MLGTRYWSAGLYLATAAAILATGTARGADSPSRALLGKKIDNVTLKGADGKTLSLYDEKNHKAIVVVFLSFECPVSNSYATTLTELATRYGERGVAFLGVCPCDDDAALIAAKTREFQLPFPVIKDEQLAATNAFQAIYTPEAFLLDGEHILRYRGRIDDSYFARLKRSAQTTRHDLKQALDELLSGKTVSVAATQAVGCAISRPAAAPATGAVTFYRDVLPILQANCQSCHRPGEVAPFSLMTYRQAVNWADDIKEYTGSRKMPPWKPTDSHGQL
jgi:peroxiredoxin